MYLIQIILMSSKKLPHSFIRKVFVVGEELPVLRPWRTKAGTLAENPWMRRGMV